MFEIENGRKKMQNKWLVQEMRVKNRRFSISLCERFENCVSVKTSVKYFGVKYISR